MKLTLSIISYTWEVLIGFLFVADFEYLGAVITRKRIRVIIIKCWIFS